MTASPPSSSPPHIATAATAASSVASPRFNLPVLQPLPLVRPHAPPSPSTRAAALSLGALATAASLANAQPLSSAPKPLPSSRQPHLAPTNRSPSNKPSLSTAPAMQQLTRPPTALSTPTNQQTQHKQHQQQQQQQHNPTAAATTTPTTTTTTTTSSSSNPTQRRPKQRRYRASPAQLTHLLAKFDTNPSPSSAELQQLASAIDMPFQSAVLWFKNRRARVPHKKAEKAAAAAKRRAAAAAAKQKQEEVAAATCMAELALRGSAASTTLNSSSNASAAPPAVSSIPDNTVPGAGRVVNKPLPQGHAGVTARELSPRRCAALGRSGAVGATDARSKLTLTGGYSQSVRNVGQGNEPSTPLTPRRPRARFVPPTPRVFSQREYANGDRIEVMDTSKGICRSWYSAVVISRAPGEISLGDAAVVSVCVDEEEDKQEADGDESPRTVRSPVASPTPAAARICYVVQYEYGGMGKNGEGIQEEVLAKRIRPAAPEQEDWRPDIGDAVEVLREGGWFVGVIQTLVIRKGYQVSFENGDVEWVRRHLLRPYQIWRGGEHWVVKKKPPLAVVRKSVGLSVTHPVCGKKRRAGGEGKGEGRGRKRAKSVVVDGSGPDGLPEGWRVGSMTSGGGGAQMVYVAPDGNRLRSLKEAQRYVKLMGMV